MSMVHDANSAKRAVEIELLLQDCERILAFYVNLAQQDALTGAWARSMEWDMGGVRSRFDVIRELITRPVEKKGGEGKCEKI